MTDNRIVGDRFRTLLLGIRQGFIIVVGAIEVYLELKRTMAPVHKTNKKELKTIGEVRQNKKDKIECPFEYPNTFIIDKIRQK